MGARGGGGEARRRRGDLAASGTRATPSRGSTTRTGAVAPPPMESGEGVAKSGGGGAIGKTVRVKAKPVKVDAGREKKVKDKETLEADRDFCRMVTRYDPEAVRQGSAGETV